VNHNQNFNESRLKHFQIVYHLNQFTFLFHRRPLPVLLCGTPESPHSTARCVIFIFSEISIKDDLSWPMENSVKLSINSHLSDSPLDLEEGGGASTKYTDTTFWRSDLREDDQNIQKFYRLAFSCLFSTTSSAVFPMSIMWYTFLGLLPAQYFFIRAIWGSSWMEKDLHLDRRKTLVHNHSDGVRCAK
jgi:hypothetical protein